MSCMADVHEVQEANDKSKFHRQGQYLVLFVRQNYDMGLET